MAIFRCVSISRTRPVTQSVIQYFSHKRWKFSQYQKYPCQNINQVLVIQVNSILTKILGISTTTLPYTTYLTYFSNKSCPYCTVTNFLYISLISKSYFTIFPIISILLIILQYLGHIASKHYCSIKFCHIRKSIIALYLVLTHLCKIFMI